MQPKMRMVWWREAKWLMAMRVLDFYVWLISPEASPEMLKALLEFLNNAKSDTKFDTVPMRTVKS